MDGNGRWARARGKARNAGHRAGVRATRQIVEACVERDIRYLTLFAFSSENWKRPPTEVRLLMRLFLEALQREVAELHKNDVRLRFMGDRSLLPDDLVRQMNDSEQLTSGNSGLQLNVAVSYGGRWDIVNAARSLAGAVSDGTLTPAEIDEDQFARALSLGGVPDPDLFIRTGGEKRISNFLLWNLAYAEFYFSNALWPDFDAQALDEAIDDYLSRQRRFGRTAEQVNAG
ncbi:MAG: di-trans,poly-cis-decaprenylcistransferase [Gammaproteobacteria bacterium]|nr:di-trans,poly-cis-decaprenylcistransferase [Gammaproteobacteria bacterium]NND60679.1 di-trans,poly-cis-decaprenylcistransferase [Gammaproteobacteria bacterium]